MLPSYSSVEKRTDIATQTSSRGNRKFYLSMIASLALLSLVGFFAYSETPLTTKAEAETENVALFVEANKEKGGKEPPFEEGLLDEDVGETAPLDEEAWEEFAAKPHEREEEKEAALEFEVNGAETAPVDEEAVRRFEMGKHEWEEEKENVEWTEDFEAAPEVEMDAPETAPVDVEENQYPPGEGEVEIAEHAPAMSAVTPGYVCQSKSGSYRLTRGQKLFDVYTGDSYDVEFYVKMDSSSTSGPIIWVGDSETDEQPEVFWWYGAGGVDVEWDTGSFSQWNYGSAGILRGGPEYLVRVRVRGLKYELYVNGRGLGEHYMSTSQKGKARKRGVWAYPSWKSYSSLQGTVRNVRVCGQKQPPPKPSSLPALYSGCVRKSGSVEIKQNNKLFEATTGINYDIAFYVTLHPNSGFGPILWIGNNEADEQPELFFFADGDLDVEWDTGSFYQFHFSDADIWRGQEFLIQVKVREREYELLVNGVSKGKKTMPSSAKGARNRRGFWAYPSWKNYPDLKGTVRDVTFYPLANPTPPPSPTPEPTKRPTAPTANYLQCLTKLGAPFPIVKSSVPLFTGYKPGIEVDITFYVRIDASSIGQTFPLLQVTDQYRKEQPLIRYNNDRTITVSYKSSYSSAMKFTGVALQPGVEHYVYLRARGYEYALFVDGSYKGKKMGISGSHNWWQTLDVYTIPYNYLTYVGTVSAQMRDLRICTIR